MKLLPKSCTCPHCGAIYRYGDIKKTMRKKSDECYHCKKRFKVSKAGFLWLAIELAALYALINIFALSLLNMQSVLPLFIINIIPAAAAVYLLPLYIELRK